MGIHDPIGLSYLTQLRVGLSKLNFHKFKNDFKDTINLMCPTNDGIEVTEPSRWSFCFRTYGHTDLKNSLLMQILLYGAKNFPDEVNKDILLLRLKFIHKYGRFDLI